MRVLIAGLIAAVTSLGVAQAQQADDPAVEPVVEPAAVMADEPVMGSTAEPAAAPAVAVGTVARAAFTTGVVEREPIDNLLTLDASADRVYFFTELLDLEGQTVTHRWQHRGNVMAEVSFEVRGPRWRVHSSKNLVPEWVGPWYVDVIDGAGNILYTGELIFGSNP